MKKCVNRVPGNNIFKAHRVKPTLAVKKKRKIQYYQTLYISSSVRMDFVRQQ